MATIGRVLRSIKLDKKGVTALEYGMIAALIALAVIGGYKTLGTHLSSTLTNITTGLSTNNI